MSWEELLSRAKSLGVIVDCNHPGKESFCVTYKNRKWTRATTCRGLLENILEKIDNGKL